MAKPILTQAYLKECLHYDPETGIFTWIERPLSHFKNVHYQRVYKSRNMGRVAGHFDITGYIHIRLHGILHRAHRLAFLYMNGSLPENEVDHIDHRRDNNKWENLRQVTSSENRKNCSLRIDNKSGYVGICMPTESNRWLVQIKGDGKHIRVGEFDCLEDAIEARKSAESIYGYHLNHGLQLWA